MNLLFRVNILLFLCALMFAVASPAYAWSKKIHGFIYSQSLKKLSVEERNYFQSLESLWFKKTGIKYRGAFAAWPDEIRDRSLKQVFKKFGASVPARLSAFKSKDTKTWHYQNLFTYPESAAKRCHNWQHGSLIGVLEAIEDTFKTPLAQSQQVVLVSFYIHLVADLHQPLHSLTGVKGCESDRGGNLYCLDKTCEHNLHWFWDTGGFTPLNSDLGLTGTRRASSHRAPKGYLAWAGESAPLANKIYSTPAKRQPTKAYRNWARQTSEVRIEITIQRLSVLLKQIYQQQHRF